LVTKRLVRPRSEAFSIVRNDLSLNSYNMSSILTVPVLTMRGTLLTLTYAVYQNLSFSRLLQFATAETFLEVDNEQLFYPKKKNIFRDKTKILTHHNEINTSIVPLGI